jgi:hypothetical protein
MMMMIMAFADNDDNGVTSDKEGRTTTPTTKTGVQSREVQNKA